MQATHKYHIQFEPRGFWLRNKQKILVVHLTFRMLKVIPILRAVIAILLLVCAMVFIKDAIESWISSPSVTSGIELKQQI